VNGATRRMHAPMALALLLAACASPPLKLYTLAVAPQDPAPPPQRPTGPVIIVDRVSLPGYLDTQDLIVRREDVLERSPTGRWATRLSVGATDLLTNLLAARRPDALVTDATPVGEPDYEIRIHVGTLDVTSSGAAVVVADWQIIPRVTRGPIVRDRTRFTMQGSVANDQSIARFQTRLFERLAAAIDVSGLR
jgi:uncharacterized protein